MRLITVFVAGLLFALGLGISGMTQPSKVIGFLDIFGNWDPSLAFVMIGAISVNMVLMYFSNMRSAPVYDIKFTLPRHRDINSRLIGGAVLFGAGWGLAGYCPGPALVSTVSGTISVMTFIGAMLAGMLLFQLLQSEHEDDDVSESSPTQQ